MTPSRIDDIEGLNQWISSAIQRGAIAIITHRNGDMDTVGSACAMAKIIGPSARACGVHLSTIARAMIKKTGSDFMVIDSERIAWPRNLGGVIVVDAAGPSQVGIGLPDVPKCVIDHHSAGEPFELNADDLYINWNTNSTAEIILHWAESVDNERIDAASRRLLLAGIVTDTGRFRHANADALLAAGRLASAEGIEFSEFIEEMESVEAQYVPTRGYCEGSISCRNARHRSLVSITYACRHQRRHCCPFTHFCRSRYRLGLSTPSGSNSINGQEQLQRQQRPVFTLAK